jgi:hypothetical protein
MGTISEIPSDVATCARTTQRGRVQTRPNEITGRVRIFGWAFATAPGTRAKS